jgi:hypothetical protein
MAMLISAAFLSCSKSKDLDDIISVSEVPVPDPTPDHEPSAIIGLWSGKYFGIEKSIPAYISFHVKNKGELEVLNTQKNVIGSGIWALEGNSFKAAYTIITSKKYYSFSGELFAAPDKLVGSWGYNSSFVDGGTWSMTK